MISSDKVTVFSIAFGIAYAVIYVVCAEMNLPLLTYHPAIGEIDLLRIPVKSGPAMYWYGWMLTSLVGAAVLASIAVVVPEPWLQRLILAGSAVAPAYLIIYTVALFIYDRASIELPWLQSRLLSQMLAAAIAAMVVLRAPAGWGHRLWPGWIWVVPAGALAVLGYYLSPYFTQ